MQNITTTWTRLADRVNTILEQTKEDEPDATEEQFSQLVNETIESDHDVIYTAYARDIIADAIREGDFDEFMESDAAQGIFVAARNEGAGSYGFTIGSELLGYAQGHEVFTAWTILAAMLLEWKASELGYQVVK